MQIVISLPCLEHPRGFDQGLDGDMLVEEHSSFSHVYCTSLIILNKIGQLTLWNAHLLDHSLKRLGFVMRY
jgi:hypothetical protein